MEHPILFSTSMVQAILEGRKTQTRRVIKTKNDDVDIHSLYWKNAKYDDKRQVAWFNDGERSTWGIDNPYGQVGDRLWVRETWAGQDFAVCCENYKPNYKGKDGFYHPVIHKAGKENYAWGMSGEPKWHSGRFMFKTSTRIWLEITDIRVQRLQEISEDDCESEGILFTYLKGNPCRVGCNHNAYHELWDSINGKTHPWENNPWVWAISFKLLEGTKWHSKNRYLR